ncbi:MAG: O-methyltransferase [Marmoricola sp.]
MSLRPTPMTDALHDYVIAHGTPPDDTQEALSRRTAELGYDADMQISPDEGALLSMLVRLTGATYVVEVGTFTGYSAVWLARGLPEDGRLLCCDVNEEWTAVAREFWRRAGVDHRIELRLGPAAETLRELPTDPVVDLAFIDADKTGYPTYYEELLTRLRPGGLIAVDNTLSGGRVVDPEKGSDNTRAINSFNDALAADPRVDAVMLTVADGVTLVRKRT